ncbi:MAG: tol-pal system protein YbgF [candidate division Zixibacteria bacterium]|nr:tol-pal system protein YbgF [candidate division Zixibacteria bacterium]NIR65685.1 tol-pal system protein YbgF [candidate division Zixibacteria bacterium]NIS16016.1 tol-pal system protein YbgF [candidate division Zixibacteria bacterium]NIS47384.1 tol-pal system protein YbgF [candidate division Zixibacteria bacterium]NIT52425.1 tol-pal system protein YbgF [candidate division Zixibacteria bacterium]
MRKSYLILIVLVAGFFLLTGCASRRQMNKMEAQLDYLEKSNANIEQKVNELDSLIKVQEESQRQFLAQLRSSIATFEQRLEQLDYKLVDLNDRIDRLAERPALVTTTTPSQDTSAASDTSAGTSTTVDPRVVYNAAYKSLVAGNNEIAILGFEEYLKSFPNTELTDDAQYWLGESYYNMDPPNYEKARVEFQKLVDNYPQSDRMASAKFKLARSLEELGEQAEAITIYRQVVDEYPQTAEANRSRVQLEGLGEAVE